MAAKTKPRSASTVARSAAKAKARSISGFSELELLNEYWLSPPLTTDERLARIRTLGQRVHGYIQFMCSINKVPGSSMEAKEKAVVMFYDRLLTFERELARIQEELQLG